jgi:hypothetical protein
MRNDPQCYGAMDIWNSSWTQWIPIKKADEPKILHNNNLEWLPSVWIHIPNLPRWIMLCSLTEFHGHSKIPRNSLSAYFAPGHPVSHITQYMIEECVHALSHTCTKKCASCNPWQSYPCSYDTLTGNDLRNKIVHYWCKVTEHPAHTSQRFPPVTPLQVLSLLVTIFAKMTAYNTSEHRRAKSHNIQP